MSSDSSPIISLATAELSELRSYLLNLLVDHAYQEGDFVLSSGQPSSYYINGKQVTLMAQGALAMGRLLLSLLPSGTQGVAGLTLGADPLVTAVSVVSAYENCPIPALIIRKVAKGHGTQAYIEGPTLAPGTPIVVLEDVVTTGKSAMLAVERLRAAGYRVQTIISLVDRDQGGAAFYQDQGLDFIFVFSIREIQETYSQKMSS
ncbi:orotate phosphoribosyltransferase [Crocosphaera sp. UHCC 0190]|uniref:orotate phosphoribosyltransferase n=1 Tax=Crocosphaera sp. UHCC 0190 TaxID=3110246 RepID=UPI002B2206A5|nr:orotate phosphoribosyltransferase [Crocosphaera sp. UHCC 0190]MEA5510098.1 orotate phosphoribosyltransferase [Crocosphaera sp. UHCC 0190]